MSVINKANYYLIKDILAKSKPITVSLPGSKRPLPPPPPRREKKTTKHDVIAHQREIIEQAIAIVSTFVITDVCYSASSKQFKEGVKRFSKLLESYER